ncbi:MAG: Rieske (2Fe-2S) protein [Marinilabiliaceae bacterium]|nr:Rieske (2Fe-2S) protein [Marinilabiliaceae bacterium]
MDEIRIKKINRRKFIKRLIVIILSFEVFYLLLATLSIRRKKVKQLILFEAGDISNFENGQVYLFSSSHFFLYRFNDGGFLAMLNKCTHLGCVISYSEKNKRFDCPCHASSFDINGDVLSSPATRALDILPIVIDRGKIYVDVDNPIHRDSFDISQLKYA